MHMSLSSWAHSPKLLELASRVDAHAFLLRWGISTEGEEGQERSEALACTLLAVFRAGMVAGAAREAERLPEGST